MANERVRVKYEYLAVSGAGKKQSAFGVFMPNADLDVRDKCTVTIEDNVNRRIQRHCDGEDIQNEPILSRDTQITLDYGAEGFTPQMLARWLAYEQGVAAAPTGLTTNEVQTLTRSGTVSGGTFTISLTHEGKTGTTEPIAYDATNADILAALLKKRGTAAAMGKLLKKGDVAVTGTWGTAITLTFGGRMAAANLALVVVDDALITGGGTIEEAQGTAGDQKVHAISRSTDSVLPLFSVITGDKNGTYDHFKYGNCAVDSVVPQFAQEAGAIVGLRVVIFCDYVPERESSYSVPACVSITPLETEDCKVKINGTFETSDVAALNAFFNNNIPREAAHAYDDIDITNAWQRGDEPSQGFTASIYGTPETALYLLAEDEETDGNEVPFVLYMGQTGNRVTITSSSTKIKFQGQKTGEAGALRQKTINIEATPHASPPLTFSASISQSATFLTASS